MLHHVMSSRLLALTLALALVSRAAVCESASASPRWVQCQVNYKMFGHKLGSEKPDECGTVGFDGPAISRLYLGDGKAETSVSDKYVSLNVQAWPTGDEVGGMIRYKLPGRETYAVVVRGPIVAGDDTRALSLHSFLGEKAVEDKPG